MSDNINNTNNNTNINIPRRPPPPSPELILQEYYKFEASLLETHHRNTKNNNDNTNNNDNNDNSTNNNNTTTTNNTNKSINNHDRYCYLNHASFGDPHDTTLELRQYITNYLCYRQPMVYHRSLIPPLIQRAKQSVCDYLKITNNNNNNNDDSNNNDTNLDNFSFVNVTAALFSVLKSIQFQQQHQSNDNTDIIITSDMLYHSLMDALQYLQQQYQLQWIQVETPAGAKSHDIYHAFETCILSTIHKNTNNSSNNSKIKLVIIDHISSKPSVLFPVQDICYLCHKYKIPILVDGAHVPGAIPQDYFLNLSAATKSTSTSKTREETTNNNNDNNNDNNDNNNDDDNSSSSSSVMESQSLPTFYAVTFHKWCNTPRGGASGGLWVNRQQCHDNQYTTFIDLSSLVVHGGWADPTDSTTIIDNNNEKEAQQKITNNNNDTMLYYLDHTSKPGYFTDSLTQGIYDESTREYENVVVLSHCIDIVKYYESSFQKCHVQPLRWKSLQILQSKWQLSMSTAMIWYGNDKNYKHKSNNNNKSNNGNDNSTNHDDDNDNDEGFEIPLLSVPLPTEQLLAAIIPTTTNTTTTATTGTASSSSSSSSSSLSMSLWKQLKKYLVLTLWQEYGVEIPIFIWKQKQRNEQNDEQQNKQNQNDEQSTTLLGVRISFGRHVTLNDIHQLGDAILDIIHHGIALSK